MIINIIGQLQKDNACKLIQELDESKRMQVEIRKPKTGRSLAQHGLYFRWVTQLAGEDGYTKEEMHSISKARFFFPIYVRDNTEGMADLVEMVREVWRSGERELAQQMKESIARKVSTKWASVEQFSEALDDIDKNASLRGIYLERGEDMYREAMGH